MRTMNRKGVSLLEIFFVLVIIGILAGIGYPAFVDLVESYRVFGTKAALNSIRSAISEYRDEHAAWPAPATADAGELQALFGAAGSWGGFPENLVRNNRMVYIYNDTGGDLDSSAEAGEVGWVYNGANGHVRAVNNFEW